MSDVYEDARDRFLAGDYQCPTGDGWVRILLRDFISVREPQKFIFVYVALMFIGWCIDEQGEMCWYRDAFYGDVVMRYRWSS